MNFFTLIAEDVRRMLASLGLRSIDEAVGIPIVLQDIPQAPISPGLALRLAQECPNVRAIKVETLPITARVAEMVEAALVRAAAQRRRAAKARAGLVVRDDPRLEYKGPRDPRALWADPRFRFRVPVRVGVGRVVRTRPRFERWSAELTIEFLPSLLNPSEVRGFVALAGEQVGLGDWRPRFGRFWVENLPDAVGPAAPGVAPAATSEAAGPGPGK